MKNSKTPTVFDNFDFGTTVTTSKMDEIYVTVDPARLMHDYADALLHDLQRRNPMKYDSATADFLAQNNQWSSIEDAAHDYLDGLTAIRIESIHDKCTVWRKAKTLVMTAVVQDALSCLGIIQDRNHGFKVIPVLKTEYTVDIDRLIKFSSFLEWFEADGIKLFKDAMPRGVEGDVDTMSCIIVGDEVKSMKVDAHPTFSYIAAFLGLEAQELSDAKRFDVKYDLFSYIQFMLLQEVRKCSF